MKTQLVGFIAIPCLVALAGCPAQRIEHDHLRGIDYPEWVVKGSGSFGGDAGRVFYGVGAVTGVKNHSLARTVAANRARAEIAKTFQVYSASLMKDYMASTTAGDMGASAEEQHIEQAMKTFAAEELSGAQVVNYWFHPDGTVYALASLDLDAFTDAMQHVEELNARVRDYVRQNAGRVHADLEREEAKREGR